MRIQKKQKELQHSLKEAQAKTEKVSSRLEKLEEALFKIWCLIELHSDKAPSQEVLIDTVRTIADHDFSSNRKPKIEWVKWEEV